MNTPLFPTTVVGSWPRSKELLRALNAKRAGRIGRDEFNKVADEAVLNCLAYQEQAGIEIVSDGEQRRDNFISFVAEKLENVKMMTVAELLNYVEDKASFEEILGTLDVPAFSLSNPAAVGKIRRRQPIALDEYLFLRKHTDKQIKIALPGPYLLTRSMWVEDLSRDTYPTKEDLAKDVINVLREEVIELIDAGVDFIQLDEPVLTELVFTKKNANRTFMCGALTAKADTEEELQFATNLINQLTKGLDRKKTRIGIHICRGNWSTQESVLLKGPYSPLIPYLNQMDVDQLILEYATPRAGELAILKEIKDKEIGLGVVNPRTTDIENVEEIVKKIQELNRFTNPMNIFLNPDCGFGTFAQRPMNTAEKAKEKLSTMVAAAKYLRTSFSSLVE
ncbi:cobalamin-independent methionine synthase II family protein [Bacillus sp. PK3_68]|uniref:cobalamin-independent methionine synthase II family protein n=1 Tax=Bacillus sp. PK3_68 TaxID=2027408 RepID=UPI000E7145B5|nr:cobalamin-independent methionine synthase II family protein [Bacillus sp. PK3_68]RJS50072.1 vitamin-B12 independent methionine synthase [Bacillus sp. PK3_68]